MPDLSVIDLVWLRPPGGGSFGRESVSGLSFFVESARCDEQKLDDDLVVFDLRPRLNHRREKDTNSLVLTEVRRERCGEAQLDSRTSNAFLLDFFACAHQSWQPDNAEATLDNKQILKHIFPDRAPGLCG